MPPQYNPKIQQAALTHTGVDHDFLDWEPRAPAMSSPASEINKMSESTPCKTMRGHTKYVFGVAHLPDRQRIITCSGDGSLRLWDLESGAQIGDEWRDEGDDAPDVGTGTVIIKWKEHAQAVESVCWSPNGEQVVGGSFDGTVRVWDVKNGEAIQGLNPIETGHQHVNASAVLEGHTQGVKSITLLQNDRLLASTSWDGTARLWNLDTPPSRITSPTRKGRCENENAYVWDTQAILKTAGLEDLMSIPDSSSALPSLGSCPRAPLVHLPSLFRRLPPNIDEPKEPQQFTGYSTFSRRSPPVVDVPMLCDKKGVYATRQPARASDKGTLIKNPACDFLHPILPVKRTHTCVTLEDVCSSFSDYQCFRFWLAIICCLAIPISARPSTIWNTDDDYVEDKVLRRVQTAHDGASADINALSALWHAFIPAKLLLIM
ncbi:WD40 repeat-like protein [Suillus hirtellus]|nr:WD40 repeat-like protein [Suillus hirtellus]